MTIDQQGRNPCDIVADVLNCDIVNKFKLQSHYYVLFQTNSLGNYLIPSAMG